jgi:two-component system, LytTR family, sensor kinase
MAANPSFFRKYKLHHVIFWVLYFVFWTYFAARSDGVSYLNAFLMTGAWFVGQAGIFYSCVYWLVPVFFNKKRYIIFILLALIIVAISAAIPAGYTVWLMRQISPGFKISFSLFFLYVSLSNFFVAVISVAAKVIKDRLKSEQRNQLLEKEKTENELRFLRSQINPHFVFNAINSIYVLIKKDPDFAATTLAKFADMLRYQLYECNVDEIPVENEISYLNNYIELEKLRKGDMVKVNYTVAGEVSGFSIAPLLLIPFVENAFKYVSAFTDKPNEIKIEAGYRDDVLSFFVENTTNDSINIKKDKTYSGIGLENVKRRLELIYPARHSLKIDAANNVYSVLLTIQMA